MLKVVFDTNIYLSGIFWGGKPRNGMELARKGAFRLIISNEIINELKQSLTVHPFHLNDSQIRRIVLNIKSYTKAIKTSPKTRIVRDSKDDMILDCATTAMAKYLVTGDKDLLIIGRFRNVDIITISEFLETSPWI